MTRVAYLVSRYPAISHTFILREVVGLRARGFEIETYSVRATDPAHLLSAEDKAEAATTTALVPPSAGDLLGAARTALRHPRATLDLLRFAVSRSVPGWRGPVWQLFYAIEALLLHRSLRRTGTRHIHAHFANVGADVARLCSRFGTTASGEPWTWSFTMHGPTELFDTKGFGLAGKVADASLVVCISDFTRSQLQQLVPVELWPRLHVVHCGIQPERFQPSERRPGAGPAQILYVGRLVPEKGGLVLVEAMRLLREEGVDAQLTMIGEGPLRPDLEAAIERAGLGDRIALLGAVGHEEIPSWYAKADIFCLPSFAEGLPIVLMEAMACGLPVVTTGITGVPELVEHDVAGLLVVPSRADQLARALRALVTDPDRRAAMGRAGRAKVVEEFDIDANVAPLAELLRSVAG